MKKIRLFISSLVIVASATTSLYGQEANNMKNENYSAAYMEGNRTAHWSVYIPIAVLAGAAIYFTVADQGSGSEYSGSQDGLGSIDNAKRQTSKYSSSGRSYSYGYDSSRGGYSH